MSSALSFRGPCVEFSVAFGRIYAGYRLMDDSDWEPLSRGRLAAFIACFGLLIILILRSEAGFVVVLDHANLLFHEAGHPLVGLFSSRLEPYGGTLGQLTFPCILGVAFWRKRQAIGVAAASIWFFENWLNIARYLADARSLQLPLVGGGDHDWNTILGRWHLLAYDTRIAAALKLTAWAGIFLSVVWLLWRAAKSSGPRQIETVAELSG